MIYASSEPKSVFARDLGERCDNMRNLQGVFLIVYASSEPKSVLARDLGERRDNMRNLQGVFLIVYASNEPKSVLARDLGERRDNMRNLQIFNQEGVMRRKQYSLLISIFLLVFMILFAGVSGMSSPGKHAEKVSGTYVQPKKIVNVCYETQELNPLTLDKEQKVSEVVAWHYNERAEQIDYIDEYKNIEAYMKDGPYVGTYIIFARYEMKIKGIYTEVPGLDTFYATVDADGQWQVTDEILTEEEKHAVQTVSEHTDVKELVAQTENEYETAVASDAILREALADLEKACGNAS